MRITTYIYPDGTKSIRKPRDGEIFRIWNHVDCEERVWQWDGYDQRWFDVTNQDKIAKALSSGVNDGSPLQVEDLDISEFINGPRCECGSEKSGSNRHSSWCKKWNPNQ